MATFEGSQLAKVREGLLASDSRILEIQLISVRGVKSAEFVLGNFYFRVEKGESVASITGEMKGESREYHTCLTMS